MNICHGVNTFAGGFTVPASATAGTTLGGSGFTLSAIANAQRIADPGWCRVIVFGNAYNEIANLTLGSDYIYCFGPGSGNNQHPANPKGSTGWVLRVEARASTAHFIGRDPLVAKVRAAVAARIGERLPVLELAKSLGVSRRTLEQRFRAETGVPLGEAILDERLARAKDLLRTTSLSCEAISAACGVCDANHLAHLFRRKFGASPSAFRTKVRR